MSLGPAINLSYVGVGPTGIGQIVADQTSGPKSKTLYGFGVLTNGNTTTAATQQAVGFIDGIQSLGKTVVLQFQSVAAPVTYQGTANTAFYSSTQADSQLAVGQSIVIAGFTNSGNNGTFTITFITASSIGVTNSSAVAETNPAATGSVSVGGVPVFVDVFVAGNSADTAAAVAAALASPGIFASAVSNTGFTLNFSAFATTAQTVHFGAVIAFSS